MCETNVALNYTRSLNKRTTLIAYISYCVNNKRRWFITEGKTRYNIHIIMRVYGTLLKQKVIFFPFYFLRIWRTYFIHINMFLVRYEKVVVGELGLGAWWYKMAFLENGYSQIRQYRFKKQQNEIVSIVEKCRFSVALTLKNFTWLNWNWSPVLVVSVPCLVKA